jgi:hypothetical protein
MSLGLLQSDPRSPGVAGTFAATIGRTMPRGANAKKRSTAMDKKRRKKEECFRHRIACRAARKQVTGLGI